MIEYSFELPLVEYVEKYYKNLNTITKYKWKTFESTTVSSSHPPLEKIIIKQQGSDIPA